MDPQTQWVLFSIAMSVIGFFLVRFYLDVKDMAKDIKKLLINEAKNSTLIDDLKGDIDEAKRKMSEQESKLSRLQMRIGKS